VGGFLDDLSNWYVRRSRRRFWKSEHDADKNDAYATLFHVLVKFARLLAPFHAVRHRGDLPEPGVLGLSEAYESVHHTAWPQYDAAAVEPALLEQMELAVRWPAWVWRRATAPG